MNLKPDTSPWRLTVHLLLFCLCITMGEVYATPPPSVDKEEKQLLKQLNQAETDLEKMDIYGMLSQFYYYQNTQKAQTYAQLAYDIASEVSDSSDQAYYLTQRGGCLLIEGAFVAALYPLRKAQAIASSLEDTVEIRILTFLGIAYQNLYEPKKAISYFEKAIVLSETYDNPRSRVPAMGCLSNLHLNRGAYHKSFPILRETLKLSKELNMTNQLAYNYKDLAFLYLRTGKLDSAYIHARQAVSLTAKDEKLSYIRSVSFQNLSKVFLARSQYDSALYAAQQAFEIGQAVHSLTNQTGALSSLANIYLRQMKFQEALQSANRILNLVASEDSKDSREGKILAFALLEEIHEKRGDYKSALNYARFSREIQQSIFELMKEDQFKYNEQEVEANLQEAENLSLKNQVFLEKSRYQKSVWYTISITILAALALIIGYLFYVHGNFKSILLSKPFTEDELSVRISYVQQASMMGVFLSLPATIYYCIWGDWWDACSSIIMLFTVSGVLFAAKKGSLNLVFLLACVFVYPYISTLPFLVGQIFMLPLAIASLFLCLAFVNPTLKYQILNIIMGGVSLVIYYIGMKHAAHPPIANLALIEIVTALASSLSIINTIRFFHQVNRDFKIKEAETNAFLAKISALDPHLIFTLDKEMRFTFVNQALSNAFRLPPEEILGKKVDEASPYLPIGQDCMDSIQFVLTENKPLQTTDQMELEGEPFWMEIHYQPIHDEQGQVVGLMGVAADITQTQIAQMNYQTLFQSMQEMVMVYDFIEEKILELNPQGYQTLGFEVNKELPKVHRYDFIPQFTSLTGELDLHKISDEHKNLLKEGEIISCRAYLKDVHGSLLVGDMTILPSPHRANEGIVVFKDKTGKHLAQKELRERQTIYEGLIQHAFDAVDIVQLTKIDAEKMEFEGEVIIRNQRMVRMLGSSDDLVMDIQKIVDMSVPKQQNGRESLGYLNELFTELLEKGFVKHDWRLLTLEGEARDVHLVAQLIQIHGKKLLIRMIKDVTEAKKQDALIHQQMHDLNTKNQELEKYISSNLYLENFAYLASHDLKAPIRTIVSFTQILEAELCKQMESNPELANYLRFIISGSKNMERLVNDLLTYSRVNTAKVNLEPISLAEILQSIHQNLQSAIVEKDAHIEWHDLPPKIVADEVKMRQLLQNLVSNALKFVSADTQPHIVISAKEQKDSWLFSVKDNGIGIKEKDQEKIFYLFRRLHRQEEYEGTGIGL
ncbi:MAG: PAS domain-containing protein, partial [Bacteroidota bacterium]